MSKIYCLMKYARLLFCMPVLFVMQSVYAQDIKEESFEYSQELLEAAKKGDADAMYKIGVCYYVGKPEAQASAGKKSKKQKSDLADLMKSTGALLLTLQGTDGQACRTDRLSSLIRNEIPFKQDYKNAMKYLQKAADKGSALAMLTLADIYYAGKGGVDKADLKKAVELYNESGENGCSEAYLRLANIYNSQQAWLIKEGIEDYKLRETMKAMYPLMQKALDFNKLAADLGSAQAAYNLNHAYLGQGTTIADYNESLKWLRRANELGHPRATTELAVRYQLGWGTIQNKRFALQLMRQAASKGDAAAIHNFGEYYYRGALLPMDKEKAVQFFYLANKKGQNNSSSLSVCYKEGLHNAAYYSSEQEWLAALEQEFAEVSLPEITLPQPQVLYTVAAGDVVNDCGSFYIVNDGIYVTERSYDTIIKDLNTGKLKASAYGFITTLANDGTEEQPILNQIGEKMVAATDASIAFSYGLQILQADPFDTMGYKAITYYNMAVFYHNCNDFGKAEAYLKRALEVNPDFIEAKECLASLAKSAKEAEKAEKKARRKLVWECILIGAQGVSDAMNNLASIQQAKQARIDKEEARKAANRARNKERIRDLKLQGKTARQNKVGMIGQRAVSNQYTNRVGRLTDMMNNGMYGTPEFRALQQDQQRLSKEYGFPSHESENW
ncbi:hypothetical protein [Bacteroides xylanisolvens]|uniref:hypothetical protein n=1 Tax=Bacteroides xylanisolvens TaxID=371601 RepID=UPI001CDBD3DE|nr:hypothetical protein [Bacteroides xylanisolvens]MCA4662771.1 hypothetical protein [Bacteroides xylanisolvens]MCA4687042.1 hypothetical protein [Bacteroides xylanisolvens]